MLFRSRPDLIWYDNLRSYRTASWHVQQLYSQYRGQNVLKTTTDGGVALCGAEDQDGLSASAVKDGENIYVKVVNITAEPQTLNINFKGLKRRQKLEAVNALRLHSDDLYAENSLDAPSAVSPETLPFSFDGTLAAPAYSFTVYCFRIVK